MFLGPAIGTIIALTIAFAVRAGAAYEPRLAELAVRNFADILAGLGESRIWEHALECEPAPQMRIAGERVDSAFAAIAAITGLKSPWLREHSTGVAELAAAVKEFPSATRRTINVSGGRERASLPTFLDSQPRTTRGVARGGPDHLHGRAQRRRSVDGPLLQPDAISRSSWSTRSIEPPFATALEFFLTEGVTMQREAGRRLL